MTGPCVVLTDPLDSMSMEELSRGADVRLIAHTSAASIRDAVTDADAIIVRAPLPADIFDHSPFLVGVVRHGAGLDMIPVAAATAAGVMVANVPGANADTVAEYVIAQMLQLSRRLCHVDALLRGDGWRSARVFGEAGSDLGGQTLGLVGTGAIGAALAKVAGKGFGMTVLGYRRSEQPPPDPIRRASLDEVFARSDFLVLACPLTAETRGLVNAARLATMKRGSVLINVARGPIVDQQALVDSLARRHLGGAVLDVFEVQPLPLDSPLRGFDRVLLTPHLAGITVDSMRRIGRLAVSQALDLIAGRRPQHLVNPEVWLRRRPGRFTTKETT